MSEARRAVDIKTGGIGTPVPDQADHVKKEVPIGGFIGFEIYDSGYAAHGIINRCKVQGARH